MSRVAAFRREVDHLGPLVHQLMMLLREMEPEDRWRYSEALVDVLEDLVDEIEKLQNNLIWLRPVQDTLPL